jgi:hypothetical protein
MAALRAYRAIATSATSDEKIEESMGAQRCLIGRSLTWLPAVPGHGASLNGGY